MNKKTEKKRISSCDICMNYTYDEDYECYTCEVDLDEDEMAHFMQDTYYNCPYFQMGDGTRLCASRCSGTGNENCLKEKTVHMMMQMVHHIGSLLTYTSELCSVHKQYT